MKITTCLFCAALGLLAAGAVAAPDVQWKLKYTEDFNGRALNTRLWQRISPSPHPPPWQRYLSTREDLARVEKGVLQLRGVVNEDKSGDPRDYLCGGIWTKDRLAVKYGKIEAKVRFEDQQGAWPAFWLLPQKSVRGWPLDGEIDIFERLNGEQRVWQTIHSGFSQKNPGAEPARFRTASIKPGWNVYALEWSPDKIVWKVNGATTHTYPRVANAADQWPFTEPMFIILDMQLGGDWAGAVDAATLPVTMEVDWLKIYVGKIGTRQVTELTRPGK